MCSENGPQNHPKVHLRPRHTQARGQRNPRAKRGPPPRCFLVLTCTIWLRFPFWRRGSDRVVGARLFQGSKPPKIVPKNVNFELSGGPNSQKSFQKGQLSIAQTLKNPMTLYALKGCMPSEDLYALKGLVCIPTWWLQINTGILHGFIYELA